jgi:hypothetical protein
MIYRQMRKTVGRYFGVTQYNEAATTDGGVWVTQAGITIGSRLVKRKYITRLLPSFS